MTRRPLILTFAVLLLAGLAAVPPATRRRPDDDSPNPTPAQVDPRRGPSRAAGSDYVLFAHLKAKDIRDSALFAEVKKALTKSGAQAEWDELEGNVAKDTGGIKPTDIDSVTVS